MTKGEDNVITIDRKDVGHLFMRKMRWKDFPIFLVLIAILSIGIIAYPISLFFRSDVKYFEKLPPEKAAWRWNQTSLPEFIIPTNYFFEVYFVKGYDYLITTTNINVNLTKSTVGIVLHAKNLYITNSSYTYFDSDSKEVTLAPHIVTYNRRLDYVYLTFPKVLPVGEGIIRIQHSYTFNRFTYGIITVSKYRTPDGKLDTLLSYRLNGYKARSALPCFDDPDIQTPLQLSLTLHNNYSSILSNSDIEKVDRYENGSYTVLFKKTPKMHVKHLSFFFGNLNEYSPKNKNNTEPKISIWTYMTDLNTTTFAYNISIQAIKWIKEYTNTSYALEKLDLIEFPDYYEGLTENWGLIFFKSTNLIVDDINSPSYVSRENIVINVAYKIFYQWFGNLVSNSKIHSWISNGISSVLTLKFINDTYPEWTYHSMFLYTTRDSALETDAFLSSHPLVIKNYSYADEFDLIQSIPKQKGASLMYSLAQISGDEKFCTSLRNYLNKYAYTTATTEQYLDEFSKVLGVNLTEFYDDWLFTTGYPVLTIRKEEGNLVGRQYRFLLNNDEEIKLTNWRIGYHIKSENMNLDVRYTDMSTFEIEHLFVDPWFLINTDSNGFYRVNFPIENWRTLSTAISNKVEKISDEDKIGIISDLFALSEAGYVDYLTLFSFLQKIMPTEESYHVWRVLINNLERLDNLISRLHCHGYYRDFIHHYIKNKVSELNWTQSTGDYNYERLRANLFSFATRTNERSIAQPAFKIWKKYIDGEVELDNSLLSSLYMTVSSFGTHLDWRHMMNLFFNASNPNEKLRLLNGLAWTKRPALLKYLLTLALDDRSIDPQLKLELMERIAKNINAQGLTILWEFVKNHWEILKINYTPTMSHLVNIFSNFATESRLNEFTTFFKPFNIYSNLGYRLSLEKIRHNIEWITNNGETVCTIISDICESEGIYE